MGLIKDAVQCCSLNTVTFRKLFDNSIYLTFDDGPDNCFTNEALDILAEYNIKATFFLIGRNALKYPELACQIKKQGHAIGLHTFSHKPISIMNHNEFVEEIRQNRSALKNVATKPISLLRPPFGEIRLRNIYWAFEMRLKLIHYTIVLNDWKSKSKAEIVNRFKGTKLTGGEIILLHDNNAHTLDALPNILENIFSKGFTAQSLEQYEND